jgi:hypothetical protein
MTSRAVYDCDQATKQLVAWSRRAMRLARHEGLTVPLERWEYDYLMLCHRKGMSPVKAVDTLLAWRKASDEAAAHRAAK